MASGHLLFCTLRYHTITLYTLTCIIKSRCTYNNIHIHTRTQHTYVRTYTYAHTGSGGYHGNAHAGPLHQRVHSTGLPVCAREGISNCGLLSVPLSPHEEAWSLGECPKYRLLLPRKACNISLLHEEWMYARGKAKGNKTDVTSFPG